MLCYVGIIWGSIDAVLWLVRLWANDAHFVHWIEITEPYWLVNLKYSNAVFKNYSCPMSDLIRWFWTIGRKILNLKWKLWVALRRHFESNFYFLGELCADCSVLSLRVELTNRNQDTLFKEIQIRSFIMSGYTCL